MDKQTPINIESRTFILLFILLNECKKIGNNKTLEKNISDSRQKIPDAPHYKSYSFLNDLKKQARGDFGFAYLKLNAEIPHGKLKISFKGPSISKLENLFKNILSLKYPNNTIVSAGLYSFIEYLKTFFDDNDEYIAKNELDQNVIISEFKNKLSNSTWFFYHHDYETDTPLTVITRLVLEFKDLTKPGINTILHEKKSIYDFEGRPEIKSEDSHTYIVINLKRSKSNPKNLQIRFVLPDGIDGDSIFSGQYIDFEKGETIITGTFILEHTEGHYKRHKSEDEKAHETDVDRSVTSANLRIVNRALIYDSGWEYFIPKEIATYLENKWMNFTKAKTNISSLTDLGKFLRDQEQKHFLNSKFNTFINYDIFLITPVGSISKEERDIMNKEIGKAFFDSPEITATTREEVSKQCFKAQKSFSDKYKINKIYYPPRHYEINNPDTNVPLDPNVILKADLLAMRQSRYVILIMPKAICTSALVKVGWAIQMEKPVYIFQTQKNSLPILLSEGYKKIIKVVTTPKKISQIPDYLLVNGEDFFQSE